MFKKDLFLPAILGLSVLSQNQEFNLCNNTTLLIMAYVLLQDHEEIEHLKRVEVFEHYDTSRCKCRRDYFC